MRGLSFAMKHSQTIGILAFLALVAVCFMPWTYIASRELTITGFFAEGTRFGKPGLLHMIFGGIMLLFFLIPKVWAKRVNVFIGIFNFSWSIRNYLLLTTCLAGECPEKKLGIYLVVALSFIMMIMGFLPKMELPAKKVVD